MSRYAEDKKIREGLIGSLQELCRRHNCELDEEQLKELKRMKTYDLCRLSSRFLTRYGQEQNQFFFEALEKLKQALRTMEQPLKDRFPKE